MRNGDAVIGENLPDNLGIHSSLIVRALGEHVEVKGVSPVKNSF